MLSIRITLETPEGRKSTLLETHVSEYNLGLSQYIIPPKLKRGTPTFIIDPARTGDTLNDEALDLFLGQMDSHGDRYFGDNEEYKAALIDPVTRETNIYNVQLRHDMIQWPCKKHSGIFHYDVLQFSSTQNHAEKGSYGHIINSPYKLTPSRAGAHFSRKVTDNIYKVQQVNIAKIQAEINASFDSEIASVSDPDIKQALMADKQAALDEDIINASKELHERAIHEAAIASRHLRARPPILLEDRNYTRMKRMPGVTIQEILSDDRDNNSLSLKQRFSLASALMTAVKTQLVDQEIVHRDLKPDNILAVYDETNDTWTVRIVDFGLAKKIQTSDVRASRLGTLLYMSPEAYNNKGTSFKSDVFAAGCMIAEIFGSCRDTCCWTKSEVIDELTQPRGTDCINTLDMLKRIKDNQLLYNTRGLIHDLIAAMTCYGPAYDTQERCTIEEAISMLDSIIKRLNCIQALNAYLDAYKTQLSATPAYSLFHTPTVDSKDLILIIDKLTGIARNSSKSITLSEDEINIIQANQPLLSIIKEHQAQGVFPDTLLSIEAAENKLPLK